MQSLPYRWLKISLINLVIVATLGVIMRYKILYPLPFVNQKHLLHGHSHFAFAGWITQALMTLMIIYLANQSEKRVFKKYSWLLWANLLTAYAMLIAFPIEGYGLYSIIFSTLSIFVSYAFGIVFWKDLNKLPEKSISHYWFKAAVIFNALSSLGAFALAFMMANKIIHQNWYLAAEYFYLHFQYNGWFFFGCMGLFASLLSRYNILNFDVKKIFWLFALALVPAYFLSTLWMPMPLWVYILVVMAAFAQVVGFIWLVVMVKAKWVEIKNNFSTVVKYILGFSALALLVKLLLQLGSTIPALSKLAFGFRPIVIGYLHLVLLGVITLFLLGYIFAGEHFKISRNATRGIYIFAAAVLLNEIVLMIQGVAAISYNAIPFANEMLLGTGLLLFTGALITSFAKRKKI
ncbi:MAG: hypothetical protein ABIT96_10535 [Ferruginibacter sp.]